jgi:hypothetical protein
MKVLDLLSWHPIQVLTIMTRGFLVSLSLLKVYILGCVKKGAAPLFRHLVGRVNWGFFSPVFFSLMGHLLQTRALKWSHQMADLWAVVGSFCTQGRLQVGSVIVHYQFVWSGQICCCFARQQLSCPTAATLAGQLLPWQGGTIQFCAPPTVPQDYLSDLPCPCFGRLACNPTPALSACSHPTPACRVQLFIPPPLSEVASASHFVPIVSGRLQFTIYVCQFCFGGVQSACVLHWIMSRGQACSAWCSPVEFADLHRQLWNRLAGWKGRWLCTSQMLTGTGFKLMMVGFPQVRGPVYCRVQFCLTLHCLLFAKENGREKWPWSFSQGKHSLCPCLTRISLDVKDN